MVEVTVRARTLTLPELTKKRRGTEPHSRSALAESNAAHRENMKPLIKNLCPSD